MKINKFDYEYDIPNYKEEFKIITYPGIKENQYMISNHGRVFNIKKEIIMKTYFDDDYHEKITLVTDKKHPKKRGNKSKHYFIHRLMAWEFIGPPVDEIHNIVNHKNGIPCCNFIDNLEWSSVLENTNHAKTMGLLNNSGVNASVCKYDEKTIRKICSLFEKGYTNMEIFELLKGHKNTKTTSENVGFYQLINKLGKKICYWDIVSEYDYLPNEKYFSCTPDIKKVREMIFDNKTNIEIMEAFGFNSINENKRFYNRIISERAKCKVLAQRLSKA